MANTLRDARDALKNYCGEVNGEYSTRENRDITKGNRLMCEVGDKKIILISDRGNEIDSFGVFSKQTGMMHSIKPDRVRLDKTPVIRDEGESWPPQLVGENEDTMIVAQKEDNLMGIHHK